MKTVKVLIEESGLLPAQAHSSDAGYDLSSAYDYVIEPKGFKLVGTDVRFDLPKDMEIQVRSRSGLAAKKGVFVLNGVGTVDPDYTGEVKVVLANFGEYPFEIKKGDRIAQLVFNKLTRVSLEQIDMNEFVSATERGDKGFGSTKVRG